MTIGNGEKQIKISSWELSIVVGGITSIICSICNTINKKEKKIENKE